MNERLAEVAAGLGVAFEPRSHAPNTKRALALAHFAATRADGTARLDAWRTAAMNAYWRDGLDIEADDVLSACAEEAGLDASEAFAFLGSPDVPEILTAQRAEARRWGVTGIPTWFMLPRGWAPGADWPQSGPQPVRVVGCQPLEVVERAAQMAGARPRQ